MKIVLLLLAALAVSAFAKRGEGYQPAPALDGTGHGQKGLAGTAGSLMTRVVNTPGANLDVVDETGLPNARETSNAVSSGGANTPHPDGLSAAVWWLGQFLDHDITFSKDVGEDIFIDVTGDEHFDPEGEGDFISIRRSDFLYDLQGTRQFVNDITSFVDLSAVYGARNYRGQLLRQWSLGRLRAQPRPTGEVPPYNTHGFPNLGGDFDITKFLVGDFRGNEQAFLLANHILFLRNHNYWAEQFHIENPSWSDDRLFNAARRWNIAEFQSIVFEEYLPLLLGGQLPAANGFDASASPNILTEFAGAGWRVGHTFLNDEIPLWGPSGQEDTINLKDAFQNTAEVEQHGLDRLIRGISHTTANKVDVRLVDAVREFLFLGPGFSVNLDLAAINILRGREMGLPTLNELREHYGLPRHTTFSSITADTEISANLASMFTSPDQVDLWIGLLQEDPKAPSKFGETLTRLLIDQYTALRDGDAYYYEYDPTLSHADREEIRLTTYTDIIVRNTGITRDQLPANIFIAQ